MADLSVEFCGVRFKNPMLVASIEPSNSVNNIKKCIDNGAAGVIVKTVSEMASMSKLTEHSKYAILNEKGKIIRGKVPRNFTFYSRSGYIKEHYEDWIAYLTETQAYAKQHNAHVIGNVSAGSLNMWAELCKMTEDCGVPMIEANLHTPYPTEWAGKYPGTLVAQNPAATYEITRRCVESVDVPVIIKLTPEAIDLTAIAEAAKQAGAAAVSVNSRFKGFATDIETGHPFIGGPAGVGGPWVKPITLRWVHDIYSRLNMEIAGSNGIFDARDAVEFIMSGARVMQVGSVLMLKSIEWLSRIITDLEKFMDAHGYASIDEMYGISSRRAAPSMDELFKASPLQAYIDHDKCKYPKCATCIENCYYDALNRGDQQVVSKTNNCIGCELCWNLCPWDAIRMGDKDLAESQIQSLLLD